MKLRRKASDDGSGCICVPPVPEASEQSRPWISSHDSCGNFFFILDFRYWTQMRPSYDSRDFALAT